MKINIINTTINRIGWYADDIMPRFRKWICASQFLNEFQSLKLKFHLLHHVTTRHDTTCTTCRATVRLCESRLSRSSWRACRTMLSDKRVSMSRLFLYQNVWARWHVVAWRNKWNLGYSRTCPRRWQSRHASVSRYKRKQSTELAYSLWVLPAESLQTTVISSHSKAYQEMA